MKKTVTVEQGNITISEEDEVVLITINCREDKKPLLLKMGKTDCADLSACLEELLNY
jgi:hypothetical protein